MKVWLDIENPPQVQYVLPLRRAFDAAGWSTILTARDYGDTLTLLREAGADAFPTGVYAGKSKVRKVVGLLTRASALSVFVRTHGKPDAAVGASRAASVVARRLGFPSYAIVDYEYVSFAASRLTRTTILYPDIIDARLLRKQGITDGRLKAFRGIKEDLTFDGVDVDAVEPCDLGANAVEGAVRVLFRPPSETSHYFRQESLQMARTTLEHLASAGAQVVLSPRTPEQRHMVAPISWRHPPIVLERPVPFLSLLKSVDLVICSGGTMLREAAYVGVPAYSIFQSEIGAVDQWLEKIGRARMIKDPTELSRVELKPRGPLRRLESNPALASEIVALVSEQCHESAHGRRPAATI